MTTSNVWFITGASKGFGLEMTNQLLDAGHRVAATSRTLAGLQRAVDDTSDNFLPLEVDLTTESSVRDAIGTTLATFGRIDVVVNNAGYGQLGSLEELSAAEAQQNFDVNVFGTLNVIRHAMPQLRKQQSGHIVNFSSVAGINGGFPGWGIYCATKFAVEEYTSVREGEAQHTDQIRGNQPGDPVKAVSAVIDMVASENPPLHLLLGKDAYAITEKKIAALQQDMEAWKDVSLSTDFTA